MELRTFGLIRLVSLDHYPDPLTVHNALPTLGPLFSLPGLERGTSADRLLETLKPYGYSVGRRTGDLGNASPKGKEKAVVPTDLSKPTLDIWGDVISSAPTRTFQPLGTWDDLPTAGETDVAFLSDRPRLFQALNDTYEQPRTLPKLGEPPTLMRDSAELLPLLMHSTLGLTTTDEVRWSDRSAQFELSPGLQSARLSGPTLRSSADRFLKIGTAVRRLEILLDRHDTIPSTSTHHAFFHALSTYLTHIKSELSHQLNETPRWNGVALGEMSNLTSLLCDLVCWPLTQHKPSPLPSRASNLLTHIHAHLLAALTMSAQTPQSLALAYIMQESSTPILALLDRWLGLSVDELDDNDPLGQPWTDLGISRQARSHGRWEYEFTPRHMPGFIPEDSRQALFEAGKSLRLLREALPGHPLGHGSVGQGATWTWGDASPLELGQTRANLDLPSRRRERKPLPAEFLKPLGPAAADNDDVAGKPWSEFDAPPGTHFEPGTLWGPAPMDKLQTFLTRHTEHPLLPFDTPTLPLFISSAILAPLLDRAKLLSQTLITVYLNDLDFLDHLDVLWAFFLAGDTEFTERANVALFGRDNERISDALGLGRRARTRARMGLTPARKGHTKQREESEWGIGLGLGLSERNQWPPGGAELAYALRTTLFDDARRADGPVWQGIEDRVSFAVRDLPEEKDGQRAKWMDPQAIEALDFLYLSYSPDRTIRHLLPMTLMTKYQRMHNLLLRVARVETVLASMYMDNTHRTVSSQVPKRGVDLRSRPPSATATAGQASDRGPLFVDHPRVEHLVHPLRFSMSNFVTALSRYLLDTAIDKNWQTMRDTLERLKTGNVVESDDRDDGDVPVLQSIHSLEKYHHFIMDRILRSALLYHDSPSQLKVYESLMELFRLVLDLGKLLKEVEMVMVDEDDGAEQVMVISVSWQKSHEAFMRALERLAQRIQASAEKTSDDLTLLMQYQAGSYSEDLAELHIRLELGGSLIKQGKLKTDEI